MNIREELKKLFKSLRDTGVPTIILQDPVKKTPSITYTMLIINFILCVAGTVGKLNEALGGVDFDQASELMWVTGGLYFGRQFQKLVGPSSEKTEEK